jgi:tetratricopeptide (TPR) repeat protein
LFRAGILHCQAGKWRDGEAELARLAEEFPKFENQVEARLWRGRAQAARKNTAEARATFAKIADSDPGRLGADARLEQGELELAAGDTRSALSAFLKVAVLFSDADLVARANWGAGRALEESGDAPSAVQRYRDIVAAAPKSKLAQSARERLVALERR